MNEYLAEILKALIWMIVGAIPIAFGLAIHIWADLRSVRKGLNAAFKKIRALEGEKEICSRDE